MSFLPRLLCTTALGLGFAIGFAAEAPKDSPFGQAGATATSTSGPDSLEFSGVSTVGKRTMINLYDKQEKRSFWVEAGQTSGGVTVVKYDGDHDQVTVRRNGAEKILPLRPPSAVVNGTAAAIPAAPAPAAITPAASTSTASLSQARQEEEARMLVSDLLEIGMAQRKAYEEAQKRAASGQSAQAQPSQATAQPAPAPAQPMAAQPTAEAGATQPTAGTPTPTPSS